MTSFDPIHLALTLPKGYAKEYQDRDLFNSIYFSKLSMYHEREGYIPILYNFMLNHDIQTEQPIPDRMLMTFYYPENRLSNLNGIVILGGQPDIYRSYQITKTITPYLESLTLDKHGIDHDQTIATIEETLDQLANPISVKEVSDIIKRSQGKIGDNLETFFPFLGDKDYKQERLSLPDSFDVDAVFMLGISTEFFESTSIGSGIKTLKLYQTPESEVHPSLAFPLIFKWQPVYNDILEQLMKDQSILPVEYQGQLIPSVVIFQRQDSEDMTALISHIGKYKGKYYYHVAVANSGHPEGQPLSLVQSALGREKFGKQDWIEKLDNLKFVPEDSIRDRNYADDLISSELKLVVPETDLTDEEGNFDLGKLRSIRVETEDN